MNETHTSCLELAYLSFHSITYFLHFASLLAHAASDASITNHKGRNMAHALGGAGINHTKIFQTPQV